MSDDKQAVKAIELQNTKGTLASKAQGVDLFTGMGSGNDDKNDS
jgi:hypothetical protein